MNGYNFFTVVVDNFFWSSQTEFWAWLQQKPDHKYQVAQMRKQLGWDLV